MVRAGRVARDLLDTAAKVAGWLDGEGGGTPPDVAALLYPADTEVWIGGRWIGVEVDDEKDKIIAQAQDHHTGQTDEV